MTLTDFAHTAKALDDRARKAALIAEFMCDTRFVRAPDPDEWPSVLRACGVNRASKETRAAAVAIWRERRGA